MLFTHNKHGIPIANDALGSQLPEATTTPEVLGDPRRFIKLMRGPLAPEVASEYMSRVVPQLSIHVESFTDTTLISVSWLHTLSDVLGIANILQAWQAVLEGREEDVPTLMDADIDPLESVGRGPVEEHDMSQYIMNWWQTVLYICNLLLSWVWFGGETWRQMYIPGDWLRKLQQQGIFESRQAKSIEAANFISRHDVVNALLAKLASQTTWTAEQPVWLYQATNVRERLSTVSSAPGKISIGNLTSGTLTVLPAREVKDGPIWKIASALRKTTELHTQGGQMDAMMAIFRHLLEKGNPVGIGEWNSHTVTASNWARGSSFEVDFAAARLSKATNGTPSKPSVAIPLLDAQMPLLAVPAFWFAGPDEQGGYWITGTMSKFRWEQANGVFAQLSR
jgi:hypothetical protein